MKRPVSLLLLSLASVSLPAFAEEHDFENFLLSSPSIISPSQFYQVKGGRFEAQAGILNGSLESKDPTDGDADISGNILGVGYAQALNQQLVLAADVDYLSRKVESDGSKYETTETVIRPTVSFSVSPMFSLGASVNIKSDKAEDDTDSESVSYTTFNLGATVHQDAFEASLALTTKNSDDEKPAADSPQIIRLHGRYKVLPVLALGVRFDQSDYPGIEPAGVTLETETSYGLILESAFNELASVEVAFLSTSNKFGRKGQDETDIHLGGAYKIASNIELGGRVNLKSVESDDVKYTINSFSLTFTSAL